MSQAKAISPVSRVSEPVCTEYLSETPCASAVRFPDPPGQTSLRAVRAVPNPTLSLAEPGRAPEQKAKAPAFVQDTRLLSSPALLADYVAWSHDYDAVTARDSAPRAYRELALMLFDREIERPWGDGYFPELNRKLADFRRHFCTGESAVCTLPEQVSDDAGVKAIADVMLSAPVLEAMRTRYGVNVQPARFPNAPRDFDLTMNRREQAENATVQFWDAFPAGVKRTVTTPVQRGVDGYLAGFNSGDFPGHFALGRDGVLIDDWLLRDRAMTFAHSWKFAIDLRRDHPRDNPVSDSEDLQFAHMREIYAPELDATYARLLPLVASKPDVMARFERERAAGDYPEEVYQHVTHAHLSNMVRIQGSFWATEQREGVSPRQLALQSLLTLQRYEPAWQFFLMDLTTQGVPMGAHAAVLDQLADPMLAFTFAAEQLKAILGEEVYGDDNLYDRLSYAILVDELFDARYLREYQPAIYQELLQPDGSMRRVSDLPRADQIRLLRAYLVKPGGAVNASGIVRMRAALATRIKEDDLRLLADTIHRHRVSSTSP